MDVSEIISRYRPLLKKHWLPLSLGLLGMIFFAYGLIGLFSANNTGSDDIVFEASAPAGQGSKEIKTILIDVEGTVEKPGVYKLPQDSRIQDALVAAGGLSAAADRKYIAKNFNLATKLTDGAKIYVPAIEEAVDDVGALNASSEGAVVNALININTASQSQLADRLSGVGVKTAEKIVAGRPYSSVNELLDKKIVGAKVFDQIKDKITAY